MPSDPASLAPAAPLAGIGRTSGRRRRGVAKALSVIALGVALFHVAWPPIYSFPPAKPFEGTHWYNPYQDPSGDWLRANFHAHGRSWGGLAGSNEPPELLRARYHDLGYDIVGLSDYQNIVHASDDDDLYIPVYEHGYGIAKQHQTVLAADSVTWLDFPLWQGAGQKQCVLDTLEKCAAIVIVNHPGRFGGYSLEDMRRLTGYRGIEIASRFAKGTTHWDAALTAGRPVWGFCSDDCHDPESSGHISVGWVMIRAARRDSTSVLDALERGSFYSVWARDGRIPNALESCWIDRDVLRIECAEPADVMRFWSAGRVVEQVHDARSAEYRVQPDDPYVRVEIETRKTLLFLNPVLRHDGSGSPLAGPRAEVRRGPTWALRSAAGLTLLAAIVLLFGQPLRHGSRVL